MLNEMTTENLVTLAAEAFEANDDAQAAFVAVELRFRGARMEAEDIEDTLSIRAIGSTLRHAGDWAHGGNVTSTAKEWHEAGFTADETSDWIDAGCFEPSAARRLLDAGVTPVQAKALVEACDYRGTVGYCFSNGDITLGLAIEFAHA